MHKISVIIPIYNVEQYLPKCIESVINQTYKNLEIILVDDGSPDKCPEICDEFAKKDNRIRVIHQKNGGLSAARNAGLEIASGDYFAFLDSDDWADDNMYDTLLQLALKHDADIVECGYKYIKNEGTLIVSRVNTGEVKLYDNIDALSALYFGDQLWGGISIVVWNKLYKSSLLSKLRFLNGAVNEDVEYTPRALYLSQRIVKINSNLHNFNIRPNSISRSNLNMKHLTVIDSKKSASDFFQHYLKSDPRLKDIAAYTLDAFYDAHYNCFFSCYNNRSNPVFKSEAKKIAEKVRKYYKENLINKNFKRRVFHFSPILYFYLRCGVQKYKHLRWLFRTKKRQLKEKFSKK